MGDGHLPEPAWLYEEMLDSIHEAVRALSRPPHSNRKAYFLANVQRVEMELRLAPHPKPGHWRLLFDEFGVPPAVGRAGSAIAAVEDFERTGLLPKRRRQ